MIPQPRFCCCVYPALIMVPMHIFLLFCIFGANFPPLDESEASRLSFAVDGRDSLGDGFAVLVENVRGVGGDFSPNNEVDEYPIYVDLIENPVKYRGVEFVISGVVEQQSPAPPPWDSVGEWFVRDSDGVPFMLYVVGETDIRAKADIVASTRFYKTVDLTGRDGNVRSFATFVTSSTCITVEELGSIVPLPLILVPIVVIGAMTVFLLSRNKPSRKLLPRHGSPHIDEVIDAVAAVSVDLPDDPADALALLHESAEELT